MTEQQLKDKIEAQTKWLQTGVITRECADERILGLIAKYAAAKEERATATQRGISGREYLRNLEINESHYNKTIEAKDAEIKQLREGLQVIATKYGGYIGLVSEDIQALLAPSEGDVKPEKCPTCGFDGESYCKAFGCFSEDGKPLVSPAPDEDFEKDYPIKIGEFPKDLVNAVWCGFDYDRSPETETTLRQVLNVIYRVFIPYGFDAVNMAGK